MVICLSLELKYVRWVFPHDSDPKNEKEEQKDEGGTGHFLHVLLSHAVDFQ